MDNLASGESRGSVWKRDSWTGGLEDGRASTSCASPNQPPRALAHARGFLETSDDITIDFPPPAGVSHSQGD